MFRNNSFDVLLVLAMLGAVTLVFGTAIGAMPAAPSAVVVSDWFERHPDAVSQAADLSDYYQRHPGTLTVMDTAGASDWFERHPESSQGNVAAQRMGYAALKDAQLERDDARLGGAGITVADGEETYLSLQKEQRAMVKSAKSAVTNPAVSGRRMTYSELKEAQLEQRDAIQFGSAYATAAGEEDSHLALQKEHQAEVKSLRGTDQPAPVQVKRKSYADLKDAQLEQRDAIQFGSTIAPDSPLIQ